MLQTAGERRLDGMTSLPLHPHLRELAVRHNDGIHIQLMWDPADDSVALHLDDAKLGIRLVVPVERRHALHAFEHPFAYAESVHDRAETTGRPLITFEVER